MKRAVVMLFAACFLFFCFQAPCFAIESVPSPTLPLPPAVSDELGQLPEDAEQIRALRGGAVGLEGFVPDHVPDGTDEAYLFPGLFGDGLGHAPGLPRLRPVRHECLSHMRSFDVRFT